MTIWYITITGGKESITIAIISIITCYYTSARRITLYHTTLYHTTHCLSLLDSWKHENAVVNQSFIRFIDLIRRIHKFLTQSLTSVVIKSILSSY